MNGKLPEYLNAGVDTEQKSIDPIAVKKCNSVGIAGPDANQWIGANIFYQAVIFIVNIFALLSIAQSYFNRISE